ncbi:MULTISPECIES: hypothetical protein [unclassified Lebetimonas]|uniref:hypothetical protein n=1 Tax=unclassified Lebetimonas TaxID=2648158 RepID=UPI00046303FE|nr:MULTISPECIES: hypothetical protein [unclassified Lebetimonas]
MIPIRDIKPNVTIIDWEFSAFAAVILLILIFITLFLFKKLKKKNPKKEILKKLQNIDFNDSKKAAYEFSALARFFINEENKEKYQQIVNSLEKYKYKKEVPPLSNEDKQNLKNFIKEIHV